MANYYGLTRSNYFSVKDEAALRDIIDRLVVAECGEKFLFDEIVDGEKKWAFSAYGTLSGFPTAQKDEDDEYDLDSFLYALKDILSDGDAILITEIGNEKLRYFCAHTILITKDMIEGDDFFSHVLEKARKLLGDDGFTTRMDY